MMLQAMLGLGVQGGPLLWEPTVSWRADVIDTGSGGGESKAWGEESGGAGWQVAQPGPPWYLGCSRYWRPEDEGGPTPQC